MSENLHPLVLATKLELLRLDKKEKMTRADHKAYASAFLPIDVEPKLRGRALRFMAVLIKQLEENGHSIIFEYNWCHINMYGYTTEINLRQKYFRKRIKNERGYASETYEKSDKLEFRIGSYYHKNWIDRKTKTLEEYIPVIYAYIEKESKRYAAIREANRIRVENDKKQKAIEAEKQLVIVLENEKTANLIADADNHFNAVKIRTYIKQLQEQSNQLSNPDNESYIEWAYNKADEIDPLK